MVPRRLGGVELVSERLVLRPTSERDLDFYFELRNCAEVLARPGVDPRPRSEIKHQIRRWMERWEEHRFGTWTVFERELDEPLGRVELTALGEGWMGIPPDEIEVGVIVHPTHWNVGIATEATLLAAADCFGRAGLNRLIALTTTDNKASLRMLEKLGMRHWGVTRHEHDQTTYEVFELTPAYGHT